MQKNNNKNLAKKTNKTNILNDVTKKPPDSDMQHQLENMKTAIKMTENQIADIKTKIHDFNNDCESILKSDLLECKIKNRIRSDLETYDEFLECRLESRINEALRKCQNTCSSSFRDDFEAHKSLLECKIKNIIKSELLSYKDLLECQIDSKIFDIVDKIKNLPDSCHENGDGHGHKTQETNNRIDLLTIEINQYKIFINNRLNELEKRRCAIPVGVIQAFAYIDVPAGWLWCNGDAISRKIYADLFRVIGTQFGNGDGETTFNVPDLRGQFLRGYPGGALDPDRAFGSTQGDAIRNIKGQFGKTVFSPIAALYERDSNHGLIEPTKGRNKYFINIPSLSKATYRDIEDYPSELTFDTSRVVPTANENRPKNVSLLFCIKAHCK